MTELEQRWRRVLDGKAEAEKAAGREPGSVCLLAISKYQPASAIAELFHLGQRDKGGRITTDTIYHLLLPGPCFCCLPAKLCLTLCDPKDCSMLASPALHYFPEVAHTHVH